MAGNHGRWLSSALPPLYRLAAIAPRPPVSPFSRRRQPCDSARAVVVPIGR
ncbi:hypothetical protein SALB1_0666 [Salinisphaera sp. LB1]|nr:hypothetical protein SALB1_0666 [Salinisphaera sp. LB1]